MQVGDKIELQQNKKRIQNLYPFLFAEEFYFGLNPKIISQKKIL